MDSYNLAAQTAAKDVTNTFSTSFGMASRFFAKNIRQDIYNIYGLVRLADEIVDTYTGGDAGKLLSDLESDVYASIESGYSTNLIVHAFAMTAKKYDIAKPLIEPFFASMRTDLTLKSHSQKSYQKYIYGSAEVVGLMCLKVFVEGNGKAYKDLKLGARALGSAFQKVNFLRDLAEDHEQLSRFYFPESSFDNFDEVEKRKVEQDILNDFAKANPAVNKLPKNSRLPVRIACVYFFELLEKIQNTPVDDVKKNRVRLSNGYKLWVILRVWAIGR